MKNFSLASDLSLPSRASNHRDDVETLRRLLSELNEDGFMALHLRFWENMAIQEIAKLIGKSWNETDRLIENSIKELRDGFLHNQLSARLIAA